MATIYYDKDADLKLLKGKTVGIIGYGSQGHAHAQNLRDSGVDVLVSDVKGSGGYKAAKEAGFEVVTAEALAKKADVIVMLVPDAIQKAVGDIPLVGAYTFGQIACPLPGMPPQVYNQHIEVILFGESDSA